MARLAEHLNEFGAWLFEHMVPLSIELALLAGIVVVTMGLLKIQSSTIRHLFWVLVLIKPIVGFFVSSPVSVYSLAFLSEDASIVESNSLRSNQAPQVSALSPGAMALLPSRTQLNSFGFFALAWLAISCF